MRVGLLLFILCGVEVIEVDNAKILGIFWTHSKSHHILGSHLLQTMAKRGHQVKILSPFTDSVNISTFDQEQLSLDGLNEFVKAVVTPSKIHLLNLIPSFRITSENFWKNRAVQDLINSNEKYDLAIIIEFYNDAILGLAHHLGASTILFSTVGAHSLTHKYVGNPNLAFYPNPFYSEASGKTFFGRSLSIAMNCLLYLIETLISDPIQQDILEKNLPNAPLLAELQGNISLVLLNSHHSIETPRPHVPNMVQIGGFHTNIAKPLPQELQEYLDAAKDGAILFSFGTNIKIEKIDQNKLEIILKGLGKIAPIKVILRSEIVLPQVPDNILVLNWLPQSDILAHPNVKVFISHGGLGGTTEAVFHGVPMLGIPFFGDQRTNIAGTSEAGYTVPLNFEDITEKSFDESLQEILRNPKYSRNAKKYSKLLRNQPMNPLQLAVWWMEHIIEHKGGKHLRNMSMDMTWYQIYMVDIIVFCAVLFPALILFTVYLSKCILKKILRLQKCSI